MAGCTMPIYIQYVALMKHPYIPEILNIAIMKLVKIDYHNGILPETKRDTSTHPSTQPRKPPSIQITGPLNDHILFSAGCHSYYARAA